ncbi:hypothetical protein LTR08_003049 [Meristemomyces frigidus]|nr:hypothetical protein LTR08_003049 [Meristemomyces frigidus]
MAGLKALMGRRRRVSEEGEDEEGPVIVDDSQSEGSVVSDDVEDASSTGVPTSAADASASATAESVGGESGAGGAKSAKKARKLRKKAKGNKLAKEVGVPETPHERARFEVVGDTEAMMNGLRMDGAAQAQEAVDFESTAGGASGAAPAVSAPEAVAILPADSRISETAGQRQRREHEEYRRKRDADPAFIPNRGNFFMHDTRGQQNGGQSGPPMRGGWPGRGGRGRGGPVLGSRAPFSPATQLVPQAEQAWKHDLHDTINEEPAPPPVPALAKPPADSPQQREAEDSARLFPKPPTTLASIHHHYQPQTPRTLSFSSTTLVGKVQIRVFLPTTTLTRPLTFVEVPWRNYLRLPDHRPPLRRDKPVRVSLPDQPPRYIFPSMERSFIFIPRQNRPNQGYGYQQQGGYHRASSTYQRSNYGGYAGNSSRRTSVFGGSVYASSVAGASRRSSMAGAGGRSLSRADAFSPMSFTSAGGMSVGVPFPVAPAQGHPVVCLPSTHITTPQPPSQQMTIAGGLRTPTGMLTPSGMGMHTPAGLGMQIHTYPLPQQPVLRGTPTHKVHQPRPQKNISMEGIESPALLQQRDPSQDSVGGAFAGQLPARLQADGQGGGYGQMDEPMMGTGTQFWEPRGQQQQQGFGYPLQQGATPLSGIPEMGMQHAQAFPPAYQPPPYYIPYVGAPQQQQQQYYYSSPEHHQPGYQQHQGMAYYAPQQGYMPPPPPFAMSPMAPPMPPPQQQSFQEQPPQSAPSNTNTQESTAQSGMIARERNGMVFYVPQSEAEQEPETQYQSAESFVPTEGQYQPAESFVPGYAAMPVTPGSEGAYFYPQQGGMWYPGQQ